MKWSKLLANLVGNATSAILDLDPGDGLRRPADVPDRAPPAARGGRGHARDGPAAGRAARAPTSRCSCAASRSPRPSAGRSSPRDRRGAGRQVAVAAAPRPRRRQRRPRRRAGSTARSRRPARGSGSRRPSTRASRRSSTRSRRTPARAAWFAAGRTGWPTALAASADAARSGRRPRPILGLRGYLRRSSGRSSSSSRRSSSAASRGASSSPVSGRPGPADASAAAGPAARTRCGRSGRGSRSLSGILDLLKGTVAVLLARWLGAGVEVEVVAALAAIIGHSRSVFLGLGGGRGVAPAFGGLLAFAPLDRRW